MQEHDHMCGHPTCYKTENDTTMYKVESTHGGGKFTVCGRHLMERDLDRTEVIVTSNPASVANKEIVEQLKAQR